MKEVSSERVCGILLLKLDQMGISREKLVKNLPLTLADLTDTKQRMDWDLFVRLMKRFSALIGGQVELEETGFLTRMTQPTKPVGYILSLVNEPKHLYWALTKMAGPAFFSNIIFNYENLGENRIRITVTIPPEYLDCPEFFYVYKGNLSCISRLHNMPYAMVEMNLKPRQASYEITLPPSMTLFKRVKRAFSVLMGARGIMQDLGVYHQQIRESYERLAEAKRALFERELKIQLFEKLANASRMAALDRLAGGVGHEINNPLMALTLNADALSSELQEPDTDRKKMQEQVRKIREAKDRIAGIVSSLMVIGSGNPDEAPRSVPIESILDSVRHLCMAKFAQSGVALKVISCDRQLSVHAQHMFVSQSLVHLLNNAFDAVLESDEKWIRIEVAEENDDVRLKVVDSGSGIPESLRERIFDPFFSTKEVGQGVGLGLSLARKYIEMQGGELTLDANSDHTCFTFALKKAGFNQPSPKKR
jgi:signal transduction histidine kinase